MIKHSLLDKKTFKKVKKKDLVSAKAVVISRGKVLLLKQPNGRWDLPGGKIDPDEDIVTGLMREVEEETGIKVWPMKHLVTKTKRTKKKKKDLLVVTFLCSTAKPVKKKYIQLSGEHKRFTFVDIDEALNLNIRKRHLKAIMAAKAFLAELSEAIG